MITTKKILFSLITWLAIFSATLLTACKTPDGGNVVNNIADPQPIVSNAVEKIHTSVKTIDGHATDIQTNAAGIKTDAAGLIKAFSKSQDEAVLIINLINDKADRIAMSAEKVKMETRAIVQTVVADLVNAVVYIEKIKKELEAKHEVIAKKDKEIASLKADVLKLQDDNYQKVQVLLGGLIVLGVIGLGVSGFLVSMGTTKLGIGVGVGAAVIATAGVALIKFSTPVAILGISLIAFLVVGGFIYVIYQQRRSITETIQTTEVTKKALAIADPAAKEEIFGKPTEVPIANQIQSKYTQALVKTIRDGLRDQELENADTKEAAAGDKPV